jgi:hypothetical protein
MEIRQIQVESSLCLYPFVLQGSKIPRGADSSNADETDDEADRRQPSRVVHRS